MAIITSPTLLGRDEPPRITFGSGTWVSMEVLGAKAEEHERGTAQALFRLWPLASEGPSRLSAQATSLRRDGPSCSASSQVVLVVVFVTALTFKGEGSYAEPVAEG